MKYSKAGRRLDISGMLIEMGQSLMKEGTENRDYSVMQTGTFLVLIGSLLFDEKDTQLFSQLCSMFSAKKVLDKIDKDDLYEDFKGKSYDELIKKINKLKGGDNNHNLLE